MKSSVLRASVLFFVAFASGLCACGGATSEGAVETTPGGGESYEISIHRPFIAGQRFRVEVEAHELVQAFETASTEEELVIEGFNESTQVAFAGVVEITAVDEEGRAGGAEVEVERFVDPRSGEEILTAGTRMIAGWQGEELHVEVDGEVLSDDAMELLELAFPLERPGSALGDELFGSATAKQIGDVWDLKRDFVADDLTDEGYTVTETNVRGQTELVGTNACGDTDCIVLEATITAEAVTISEDWDMADFEAGDLEAVVRIQLPLDLSRPAFSEEATTTGRFVVEITEGEEARDSIATISRMRNATYTLLPAE